MGLKEANIYLDNQLNTFYAGQTINGRIEYVFDSPKKVRGIQVQFKGEAHTEWYESKQQENEQGKTESNDTTHTGNEEYFQVSYYVLGSSNGNEIEIPAGKQVYNFTCTLPPVLPSSFEGEYGYVRYTVKVTLDRPWKFNQDTKMAFTVINALDLNLNPSYREPIHIQMEKTFCCFCCASPPLSVDVLAPVSGYCPGQVIPITVNIENKSNVQVHLVKIFLRKVVTYRASSGASKKTKDIILTVQEGPAPAGSTKHWNLNMEIPPIPPSNLVNCNIIDLDYDFKMPNTEEKWKNIAKGFNDKWNFPNCLGALDGKHVRIEAPFHSGTDYYNFKEYFSIVLMALVDSDYNILYANVGCQGRISDGGVFSNTILDNIETLNVPEDSELPGRPCRTPYVIITDNAFPLTERFIKPYTSLGKKGSKIRIFNYRLSRARRMVESTFGILSKVYGCFRRPFKLQPSKVTKVVMALLHLHNFLRRNDESRHLYEYYAFQGDRRNATNDVGINVGEAEETNAENANIEPIMLYNFSPGEIVRDEFAEYFCSHQGKVPWQNKY